MWPPILGHQSMDRKGDFLREVSYSRVHLLHHTARVCHIGEDGKIKNLPSWRDGDVRKFQLNELKKPCNKSNKGQQLKNNIKQSTGQRISYDVQNIIPNSQSCFATLCITPLAGLRLSGDFSPTLSVCYSHASRWR